MARISQISFSQVVIVFFLSITYSMSVNAYNAMENPQYFTQTLCEDEEEIYFSCIIKDKIMSICAAENIAPDKGYVQYRYGRPENVEMRFPKTLVAPLGKFSISDIVLGNISFVHLKFKSGAYDYVLFEGSADGIYINRGRKNVLTMRCDSGGEYTMLSPSAYRGIPTVEPTLVDDGS
ncbi:hypothetical protein JOE11_000574 [Robbsia andropogonis]|uniref:hypothetical protein n=1 Tax=Robbsia andropogonis TaxID=28092 RepID=UPI002A6A40E9|nr:hypothetical protein [Robbsia andropogonis]